MLMLHPDVAVTWSLAGFQVTAFPLFTFERPRTYLTKIYALDVETGLIRPGLQAPPLVCVSYAYRDSDKKLVTGLHNATPGVEFFGDMLLTRDTTLVLQNGAFDLADMCEHEPNLLKEVFQAYRDGRIRDTKVREELLDIYHGRRQENGSTFVNRNGAWVKTDYKLSSLVLRYLGKDRSVEKSDPNGWRIRYAELAHLDVSQWPEAAREYAIEDSTDTLEVYEAQWTGAGEIAYLDTTRNDGAIVDELNQVKAAWALHLMSAWGIRTDPEAVDALEKKILQAQKENRDILSKTGLIKKKPATAKDVRENKVDFYEDTPKGRKPYRWSLDKKKIAERVVKVYTRKGLPIPKTDPSSMYPEGQISTSKDTLTLSGSKLLQILADGGGVDKIRTTYLPALKAGTKFPINVRYNVLVNSGRTSAYGEKIKDPRTGQETGEVSGCNIQNQPTGRKVGGTRECFVPRKGRKFVSVDYKANELNALAEVCFQLFGQSRMMEVINGGKDLHTAMAADMLKVSYEDLELAKTAVDKNIDLDLRVASTILGQTVVEATAEVRTAVKKVIKRNRDCAKVANFGFPGGLGAQSLVDYARVGYGVVLTLDEARDLKYKWLQSWPEMQMYFRYVSNKVGLGSAKLEQFWSGRIRGEVGYCDGCNTFFQGLAADGAKRALFEIVYEMYVDETSPLFGCRLVAFIHDEFLAEILDEVLHEASFRLCEIAIREMAVVTPNVKPYADPAAMTRWLKNAEMKLDENGRLIPWA